ncbi:MAG: transcription antitermination factor NusB [Treponema sp.]|jgi:N utilization substance protein B|nr:transcription antitermination factor NusB [Treponema sp.]
MASRRKGRILAFQALYCWESNHVPVSELMDFSWLENSKRASLDETIAVFSRALIAGTIENIGVIDSTIKNHLQNWDISRLNRVDLAILRMSTYTLMFQSDIAPSIVIDEAIGISREFGAAESFRFINGVLDSIRRTIQEKPCPAQN